MVFYFPFYFCRVDEVAPLKCMKIIALCVCVCVCVYVCVCLCVCSLQFSHSVVSIYIHTYISLEYSCFTMLLVSTVQQGESAICTHISLF